MLAHVASLTITPPVSLKYYTQCGLKLFGENKKRNKMRQSYFSSIHLYRYKNHKKLPIVSKPHHAKLGERIHQYKNYSVKC